MSTGLLERLAVSVDRDWLVAQIDAIDGLSFQERISAGKCLGRFDRTAWSVEEVAFLNGGNLDRVKEITTIALDYCTRQAPNEEIRAELNRIGNWLFPTE